MKKLKSLKKKIKLKKIKMHKKNIQWRLLAISVLHLSIPSLPPIPGIICIVIFKSILIVCVALKKIIQMEILQNGVWAAIPKELPCRTYSSNLWNIKTVQNNPWTEPKALYSKQLFAKLTGKADIMTTTLKIKHIF